MAITVILYGVGQIGTEIGRLLVRKPGFRVVGAVDRAPNKVGRDLGQALGLGRDLGIEVAADAGALFSGVKAEAVAHATGSYLREVYPQLAGALEAGLNVVSTCEELSFPYRSHPEEAQALDRLARRHGARVLGTGINPGFVMDTLPILLSGACQEIREIRVSRVMNAATRRPAFQKKIGAGLTPKEFREKMETGAISGHVGLEQSIAMLASAVGWKLEAIEVEPAQPVIAPKAVESPVLRVGPGQVSGLSQQARGVVGGRAVIVLDFQAYLGAAEEYDAVTIDGVPPVRQRISPCLHGDAATAAIVVNAIPKLLSAPPGLHTMKDLPLLSATLG